MPARRAAESHPRHAFDRFVLRGRLALVLAVAVVAPSALAAHGKKRLAASASATPEAAAAPGAAPARVDAPIRPLTLAELRAVEEEPRPVPPAKLRELIGAIDRLPPGPEADAARASRRFELARLHAEQERYYRYRKTELSHRLEALAAGREPADGSTDGAADRAQLAADLADAEERRAEWLKSATEKFAGFVAEPRFADYRRMDQALVALINLHLLAHDEPAARPLVKRLVTDYKESLSMPEAYLAFAEYFFDTKDWDKAVDFYGRVLNYPASVRYDYARYKLAWAALYRGDYRQAMKSFVALVGKDDPRAGDEGDPFARGAARLAEESRLAVAWTYALVGDPKDALRFFGKAAPAHEAEMAQALVDDLERLGKTAAAAAVYGQMAEALPDAPLRCDWLVRAYDAQVAPEASAAERLHALAALVAADEKLQSDRAAPSDRKARCGGQTRARLVAFVSDWHRATAGLEKADLDAAIVLYRHFRDEVATNDERAPLDAVEAELLAQTGKPCEGVAAWVDLFRRRKEGEPGPREQSARGAIESFRACLASSPPEATRASIAANLAPDGVALYAAGGDPARALEFFDALDPRSAPSRIEDLAALYTREGQKDKARAATHPPRRR